ncbi:two-component system, response regulator YcbB [Anaerovirgula multivorans]|uniref:Stage 0 sporulation protein A homolog n=2 Tax=Anaerovirgula multivorans TaxID=312168 RepID=A0A239DAU8_9FIRM|nr:two-component system, response regulator YcbB [Anaerovirgula multivorans]
MILMTSTFLIIDDDINVRKMLTYLIIKNNLGKVVEELDNGEHAPEEIMFYQPDIVLIDFLLPQKDGIEIIQSCRSLGYKGKFIMISQVDNDNMIAKAYENGIIFFIHKPINNIEAINVIKGVCQTLQLERSVAMIKDAVFHIEREKQTNVQDNWREQIDYIFTDIGIIGESGCKDLIKLIEEIVSLKKKKKSSNYQLQDIYQQIAEEERLLNNTVIHARTIEQRIRRTILKALENIAALGNDDYYNSKFIEHSGVLFDFKQVKQEINHINNSREDRGKISVKKFVEGVVSKLNF